jgi:hypothetical protein
MTVIIVIPLIPVQTNNPIAFLISLYYEADKKIV